MILSKCNFVKAMRYVIGLLALVVATYAFGIYQGHIAAASLSNGGFLIEGRWWSHMDPYPINLDYMRSVLFLLAGYCVLIPLHRMSFWFFARIGLLILATFQLMRLLDFKFLTWNNDDDYLGVSHYLSNFEILLSLFVVCVIVLETVHFFSIPTKQKKGK